MIGCRMPAAFRAYCVARIHLDKSACLKVLQVIWNAANLNGTAIEKTLISMYGR